MTKLEKLYSIIENSKDVGVKLTKDVLQQVEALEEDIIKEEILPALSNDIAPRLKPIRRDLVLVVEYHPGEPISVKLSRKMNVAKALEAKQITPASPKAGTPVSAPATTPIVEPHESTKQVVNHTKGLKVTFRDGTVISERTANNTLIRVLQKIGLAKVASADIKHGGGYGLVSKTMRPPEAGRTWQHQVGEYYVYTNTNNQQKKDDLRKLSDMLDLGLVIEDGK